jgi:hypothetical protein
MADDASGEVPVTFAQGVLDDVAEVTATVAGDDQARKDEAEALKRRIAELLVECKGNPFIGEPWEQVSIPSSPTAAGFDSTFPPRKGSRGFA